MYRKFINAFQLLSILFQSIYTLALPIGIGALASFLLTKYVGWPTWIWALFLTVGTFTGLYSMIKYILSAIKNLERLEKQREASINAAKEKKELQERLRRAGETKGSNNNDEK